jgi:hypothetical protein
MTWIKVITSIPFMLLLPAVTSAGMASEVMIHSDHVYVPKGFDANDNSIEVIVTGVLPNTCHRRPTGTVKLVDEKILIGMTATKISGPDVSCIQALVPYIISVPLGRLKEGRYLIGINPDNALQEDSELSVEKPGSNSIDNFTYANVSNIKRIPGTDSLLIIGSHPSSCMDIERVEVVPNAKEDTIAILPIVKQINTPCDRVVTPFSYQVNLPKIIHDEVLIHVRRIDGTAINFLLANEG